MDANQSAMPIHPFDDNQLKTKAATAKPVPLDALALLSTPSHVVVHPHFLLQPAFAMKVDKVQGQTMDRVVVVLLAHQLAITIFQHACLPVAVSWVKERQHLCIWTIQISSGNHS